VLFIEKEGFDPILKAARIADKYDLAIKSTKGMSVTAARALADEMCSDHDIPLLLLHDFDKAGFSIAGTLQRDTRRYEFKNDITVVDIALSLADVEAMGLEPEYQHHPKEDRVALENNLRINGASEAEIAFVERKLRENGVAKIIPDEKLLAEVYAGIERGRRLEEAVEELDDINTKDIEPPVDLEKRIKEILKRIPHIRWDAAIELIVDDVRKGA